MAVLGNGMKILVVVEQLDFVGDSYRCNHAVDRFSNRYAFLSQRSVDVCSMQMHLLCHRKEDQALKIQIYLPVLLIFSNTLQNFCQNHSAYAYVLTLGNQKFQNVNLCVGFACKEVNPDRCVNKDHYTKLPLRQVDKSPCQSTLPFNESNFFWFSRRRTSFKAKSIRLFRVLIVLTF
jgi:hypothetical protein